MSDRIRDEALEPCPFCGGEADRSVGENGDGSPWPYVECLACGASAEPEVWNKRVALAARPEASEGAELAAFLSRQIEWSARTFGTGRHTIGILKHIEKEIAEVKAKPEDLTEWIDIIILAIEGYWRHGGSPQTITRDLFAKAEINHKRTYPMPASEDEPSEHIREAAPAPEQGEGAGVQASTIRNIIVEAHSEAARRNYNYSGQTWEAWYGDFIARALLSRQSAEEPKP